MHTVQQTVKISQVQFLDWLSTRPLLCSDRCRGSDGTEFRGDSAVAVRSCGSSTRSSLSEGRFCCIVLHFSHSVRMDVSAHFSALMTKSSSSSSQVFSHTNSMHAPRCHIDKDMSSAPGPHHHHHHLRSHFGSRSKHVVAFFFELPCRLRPSCGRRVPL